MDENAALFAIQKKLAGKKLTYKEIYSIMDEIAHEKLGTILTTYFAAAGYTRGFTDTELFYLTRAMIETGTQLRFKGIVADKHSIGGVPGTRTTLIVVPIIASAGFKIPKSSSRAITTPGGTADDMETLASVAFTKSEIYEIVEKTNGCIVWGGSVDIAPADDELIEVEEPLMLESFDKILVSIMAKKIAFGSNHIVIDLPFGQHVKVHSFVDAEKLKSKFEYLAKQFGVKIRVMVHKVDEPVGRGIGPILEAKDAMMVLEQDRNRPLDLEKKALMLSSNLLDLCLESMPQAFQDSIMREFGDSYKWATQLLTSGQALQKMKQIIKAQNGNPNIKSAKMEAGKFSWSEPGKNTKTIKKINSKNVTIIAKILGAPSKKKSGVYLDKKIGEKSVPGEANFTLYSESSHSLKEARDSLKHFPILEYE